jgi:hypothetical protein
MDVNDEQAHDWDEDSHMDGTELLKALRQISWFSQFHFKRIVLRDFEVCFLVPPIKPQKKYLLKLYFILIQHVLVTYSIPSFLICLHKKFVRIL